MFNKILFMGSFHFSCLTFNLVKGHKTKVRFRMGKENSFPSWESITSSIDLIVFYLDGLDL